MPIIKFGDIVTVNHPVDGIVTGKAQWVTGSRFSILKEDKTWCLCESAYVIARYQTVAA